MTPSGDKILFEPSILVVDDEKRIRDACHKMLTQEGFEVALAENGRLALDMIEEKHYDIILLDLMMPDVSGMEVLDQVKMRHADTVIIVITGYATLEHSIQAMKKGAFDFISKPFSPQELRDVIAKAIEYIRNLQDILTEKSRMRVLINHLSDGVMATDAQKKVALANPAFLKMIGYQGKSVLGMPAPEVFQDETLTELIDQALAMPKDKFTALTAEITLESDGGKQEKILGVRCIPFRDRLDRNLGTITVLHDITTLRKMDQLKTDFVSMVSHEIRNPLNSVLAQIKVIMDGLAGDVTEKQSEILGRASEKLEALAGLTTDLLDLARIESGLLTQEKERLEIAEILTEQVDFYRSQAQSKQIRLNLKIGDNLPRIMADRYNMEEVFSNLISNAIKYTPEGGQITVSAGRQNGYLRIEISDTGIGIEKKDLDHIFERFYRVKNEKTRFIVGTGLGLSLVKSILDAHHGTIQVSSQPGHGTTFSVYLPATG